MILAESSPSVEKVGGPMRERLAGFARTLRDNGFKVGLAETRDALAILTHSVASRPTSLRSAFRSLFCATHSDWERFDEIFDAHWLGFHMRRMHTLSGIAAESRTPARRPSGTVASQGGRGWDRVRSKGSMGQPDNVERRKEGDGRGVADGRGRREGASRFENFATTDFRHITDPGDMARVHALAERLARVMRSRLV